MARLGLLVGGIALIGGLLLTIWSVMTMVHPAAGTDTCLAACLSSDSILGRAGLLPEILMFLAAGGLVSAVYFKGRQKDVLPEKGSFGKACQYCGKQIHDEWVVCPFCGQSTVV